MTDPTSTPPPPPPEGPHSPPTRGLRATSDSEVSPAPAPARRIPRLEDFPETGPNALATFRQRGWARVADELMVAVPLYTIVVMILTWVYGTPLPKDDPGLLPIALNAGAFALQILYEVVAVAIWGRTLGKWITGVRVARYSDGRRPTLAQAALRPLIWAAPGALGLVVAGTSVVGALPIFLSAWSNPLRRAWHDVGAGTIVVATR